MWGLRDLGELCDHLHIACNSPSRRSPSSRPRPGLGRVTAAVLPARRGVRSCVGLGPALPVADSESGGPRPRGAGSGPWAAQVSTSVVTHREPRASSHHDARQELARRATADLQSLTYGDSRGL